MGRKVSAVTATPAGPSLPGGEELLAALTPVLLPLIRLMVAQGIDYPQFAAWLKTLFLEQAEAELIRRGQKVTDSAVSLLSGVHRKDVRQWREQGLGARVGQTTSLSSQVFTAWKDEPAYCQINGQPRLLPRTGPQPSFESLVRSLSQDVHPYTVLNDLLRLGLARLELVEGVECVQLNADAFVPPPGSLELLQLFGANLADHVASATANLLADGSPRLEQSVFADGLSEESVERLAAYARTLWEQAHAQMVTLARRLYEQDKDGNHHYRMRFGAYYHCADDASGTEN